MKALRVVAGVLNEVYGKFNIGYNHIVFLSCKEIPYRVPYRIMFGTINSFKVCRTYTMCDCAVERTIYCVTVWLKGR